MFQLEAMFGRLGNKLFQYAYLLARVKDGTIPDWWLQDPKYFENCAEEIKAVWGVGPDPRPEVSIHVRRGDYVGNPHYVDLSQTDYYERAIAMFPNEKFLVFSDDLLWCDEKWGHDERFKVVYGNDELADLNCMASCQHNIIANSSFSWWGAYLNRNPQKKVVAPSVKNWYADGIERTVCPQEWLRI